MVHDMRADRSEQESDEASVASGPHHQEIGLFCLFEQDLGGRPFFDLAVHLEVAVIPEHRSHLIT